MPMYHQHCAMYRMNSAYAAEKPYFNCRVIPLVCTYIHVHRVYAILSLQLKTRRRIASLRVTYRVTAFA